MLVRWPGRIQPGRVSDLLWYFPDMLPTLAELAGATPPADIDGLSIVPELLGESVARRPQPQHDFLYWELGPQTAVRVRNWKAIRPRPNQPWELYDLSKDISEEHNVAAQNADVLDRMMGIADKAHEPVREGVFHDTTLHEKDRRAKFGETAAPADGTSRTESLPSEGLIANKNWKVVRASSENKGNQRFAASAIDGNPATLWHTQFQPTLEKPPHELVIDLGAEHTIRGFCYLARQDTGWNGVIEDCEFFVSDAPNRFADPVAKVTFQKTRKPQEVNCEPVKGRYIRLRALSEVNGGPWASVAELGVIGD
jgi:hypothetical protein